MRIFAGRWSRLSGVGLLAVVLLVAGPRPAHALTTAQLTTLKADIAADATLNALPKTPDNAVTIAAAYNLPASPAYWVWKTSMPPDEYTGNNGIVWTEVDALAVGKARIFEWMSGGMTRPINPSDPNQRQGLSDAFAAGTTTRTNLIALARRQATRLEKLFAVATVGGSGTRGSTANPDTMVVEGALQGTDVEQCWAIP
jgi:hypothetical protein